MSKRFCWIWHKLKNTNGRRQFVPAATIKRTIKVQKKSASFRKNIGEMRGWTEACDQCPLTATQLLLCPLYKNYCHSCQPYI
ncbi:unnamed protein product [Meloidogyne enterolobii]|uniref:Uncharacterized protein n=1 Tax=Meloidogyne enterolobii TaxID=390850 RepID=A0ACB0ZHG2_MELEN